MTREFAKEQLARIQAFWPSLPASKQAVDEFVRALGGFTSTEVEKAVTDLIDTHLEPGAPKLGHVIAKARAARPRTYDTATEEERELYFSEIRRADERKADAEIEELAVWCSVTPGATARLDVILNELLAGSRAALTPTALRRVHTEFQKRPLRIAR